MNNTMLDAGEALKAHEELQKQTKNFSKWCEDKKAITNGGSTTNSDIRGPGEQPQELLRLDVNLGSITCHAIRYKIFLGSFWKLLHNG